MYGHLELKNCCDGLNVLISCNRPWRPVCAEHFCNFPCEMNFKFAKKNTSAINKGSLRGNNFWSDVLCRDYICDQVEDED